MRWHQYQRRELIDFQSKVREPDRLCTNSTLSLPLERGFLATRPTKAKRRVAQPGTLPAQHNLAKVGGHKLNQEKLYKVGGFIARLSLKLKEVNFKLKAGNQAMAMQLRSERSKTDE